MVATVNASTSAGVVITPDNSGVLAFQSSSATALTIDASQNVGIGVASSLTGKLSVGTVSYGQTSPVAQVNGASKAISNNGGIFSIGATDAAAADVGGSLGFTANSGANGYATGQISGRKVNNSDYSSYMAFTTCNSGGTLSEAMRIDSAGSVAIGSTSTASATRLTLKGAGTGSNTLFNCQDSGGTALLTLSEAGKLIMATSTYGLNGQFQAGITASTGSMNALVAVAGDQNGGYPVGIKGNSSTQGLIGFYDSSTSIVGSVTKSGSNVAYNTSSDYRLKENIVPMTGALTKVAQLKPVTYKWKADGSNGQGFIAHELQAVIPDCVTGEKDAVETYTDADGNEQTRPKHQGVDTSFLVATLTAAIQELKAINDTLTARIVALENR